MRALPVPDPGTPDHRGPWRYLAWVARNQLHSIVPGVFFAVIWMVSQALMPAALGRAVDAGVKAKDGSALTQWALVLLALGVIQAASGLMRHRCAVFNWLAAAYRTIQVIIRQATRLGGTLPKRLTTGEVVSVGVADVSKIGDAMDITARGSGAVISIVVVTVVLLSSMPQLGLVVLIGVPLILVLSAPLMKPLHRRQARQRELSGELTTRAADIVAGLRVLRGIGGERLFAQRFRDESQGVRAAGVRTASVDANFEGVGILMPGILLVVITWLGAHYAADRTITPGELVAFYGYAAFLVHPLWTIAEAADKLTKAHVAAGRIVRILGLEPEFPGAGTVAPVHEVLADPASGIEIKPGRLTAVVAGVQAGELADRLGGYTEAETTYGGVPLADLDALRRRILVAINEDRLFTGTIRPELNAGAGEDELEDAIWAACAEDIIEASGLDGPVAEGGREFSGGQQQRLRLARALAAAPEVLIMVEPTSAVDAHTEARIAERLGKHRADRTTVIFTSSPLVLDHADEVLYIEDGLLSAQGIHTDLLKESPSYRAAVTRD